MISLINNTNICPKIINKQLFFGDTPVFNVIKRLGEGGKHYIYLIERDTIYYVYRIYKNSQIDYDYTLDCVSNRYALIFSDLYTNNFIPNFTKVINTYICPNNYSISIQEYTSYGDLSNFITNKDSLVNDILPLILQSLITIYFTNTKMNISINDAKPENILVFREIEEITYIIDDEIISFHTNYLAKFTDFDDLSNNTFGYNSRLIFLNHYLKLCIKNLYSKIGKNIEYIDLDNIIANLDNNITSLIKNCYRIVNINKDYLKRDILNLCSIILSYSYNPTISVYMTRLLKTLIIDNMSFMLTIRHIFGDIISSNINSNVFNLDNKIPFNNERNLLYSKCLLHHEYSVISPDKYLHSDLYPMILDIIDRILLKYRHVGNTYHGNKTISSSELLEIYTKYDVKISEYREKIFHLLEFMLDCIVISDFNKNSDIYIKLCEYLVCYKYRLFDLLDDNNIKIYVGIFNTILMIYEKISK